MVYLGYLFLLIGLIGYIIIVIDAFKNAVWKGLVSFFCFIYWLIYAFTEFKHEKKWPLVIGTIVAYVVGYALVLAGGVAALAGAGASTPAP